MLGRPFWALPVFMNSLAGAWLKTSVPTVWTSVMSSTICAWCGNSSETQAPLLPYRLNFRRVPSSVDLFLNELSMKANRLPSK
jgi:hypothetical protein